MIYVCAQQATTRSVYSLAVVNSCSRQQRKDGREERYSTRSTLVNNMVVNNTSRQIILIIKTARWWLYSKSETISNLVPQNLYGGSPINHQSMESPLHSQ